MTTIQDVIGDYTPLSNNVVKKLKLIRGALACKIFYTSNLHDRVCRMGLRRIADELGIDHTTASKNIEWLVDNGYIERVKEHTTTDPAHYRCTQKFYDLAKGVDLINTPVDLINTPVDLINKEEESKEESKETTIADDDFSKVCKAYENEIGFISPKASDIIKDWCNDYPTDWILEGIELAVKANVRRINYVDSILKRWKVEGRHTNGKARQGELIKTPDGGYYL